MAVAVAGVGFAIAPHGGDDKFVVGASALDGGLGRALASEAPSPSASASTSPSANPSATPTGPASASPSPAGTGAPGTAAPGKPAVPAGGGGGGGRVPGGLSGIVVGSRDKVAAWEQFRGSKVTVIMGYTVRDNWNDITNPWIGGEYAGWDGQMVISQPLFPEGGGDFGSCANGAYSSQWAQFGNYLNNIGRPKTIVRLAWEFNGDWFPWSVGNTDVGTWKRCFQQVVGAIRSTDPQARIDWTMNAHSGSPYDAYPGDGYVDIIGIDNYDMWPPSLNESSWSSSCNSSAGLCDVIRFARQHGKQFSVSEWGLVSTSDTGAGASGQAGGDNPFYIRKMYDTFKANADALAYETYFNNSEAGNVHSSLLNPNENPNGAATYASLW
ncbi:beta-mannanase [Pseudofrankia sp. BMG5.36]|nr:beta-mannanase [Pseudofrankia sp. BMG5.36]